MSDLPILSASILPRVMACPASHVLPQISLPMNEAAARGINIHAFLEHAYLYGREAALQLFDAAMPGIETARAIPTDLLWENLIDGQVEATFAFQGATGLARLVGTQLKRSYENTGEIVGTADLIGRERDSGQVIVADYKTGAMPIAAAANQQLAFLALCAALHFDVEQVLARVIMIRTDGTFYFNDYLYTRSELTSFASRLAELQAVVSIFAHWHQSGTRLPVSIGEYCKYCPAVVACPAAAAVYDEFAWAKNKAELVGWDVDALSATEAGALWERLLVIEKAVELQKEQLKNYARLHPLNLSDGKNLMLQQTSYTQISLGRGLEIIRAIYGAELAEHLLGSTNAKLPKAEIEAAFKAAGLQGGVLRETMAKLNQEFDQQGALIHSVREIMQVADSPKKSE